MDITTKILNFLEEKKFAKGKDQDYLVDDSFVLSFNETDEKTYKDSTDKTHDSASHAIKHLGEFNISMVKTVISSVKTDIKEYMSKNTKQFCKILKKHGSFLNYDIDEVIRKADLYILLNTLDLINDKVINKANLTEIEKMMIPYIRKIEKEYLSIIKEKLNKAVMLEKLSQEEVEEAIKKNDIITFYGWQKVAQEYTLDLSDNSIIISTPDYIRTLYKFDKPATGKAAIIANFYSKKFTVESKPVEAALRKASK